MVFEPSTQEKRRDGARRRIVGSGHSFHLRGALARAKDSTLHPRDAIIPNYFSISAKEERKGYPGRARMKFIVNTAG